MTGDAASFAVRRKQYLDSVTLMRVSRLLSEQPGVVDAAAVMATPANKGLLRDAGFSDPEIDQAIADDVVVCVRGEEASARAALARLDDLLQGGEPRSDNRRVHTLDDALAIEPGANIAVISVPGSHAAAEARRALERGLHIFLFSSGVSLEDEIGLKRLADSRGLIVMGPDCGTALIQGVGIGFANAVRTGSIGIVGGSGTGIQAVTSLVHLMGSGISHAIGTGSRDLTDAVGGISTLAGLRALAGDPGTAVIVLLAKAPDADALGRVQNELSAIRKPVVTCFFGDADADARTLDEAALKAVSIVEYEPPGPKAIAEPQGLAEAIESERRSMSPDQRFVRGLFAGGTFCYEAQRIFVDRGVAVRSNAPLRPELSIDSATPGATHTLIDMGAEEFTQGRPHPMIDPRARRQAIGAVGKDPSAAVLLLDFVLGYGASADPVADLVDTIVEARASMSRRSGHLSVIASICGTDMDPQDIERQEKALLDAGAIVLPTSAQAARAAARLAEHP